MSQAELSSLGDSRHSISILTATFNAEGVLPRLVESLESQTDPNFRWIIADGASSDSTLRLLESSSGRLDIDVDSRPDRGIYDALNRAVERTTSDYYLVAGADDVLHPTAIERYREAASRTGADLISARFLTGGRMSPLKSNREWLYGAFAHVSGHAVGLMIRRSLHDKAGLYPTDYRISADQIFIVEALRSGAIIERCDFVAGEYGTEGVSGSQTLAALAEQYRAQIALGHGLSLQTLLFAARVMRNRKFIRQQRLT